MDISIKINLMDKIEFILTNKDKEIIKEKYPEYIIKEDKIVCELYKFMELFGSYDCYVEPYIMENSIKLITIK